MIPVSGLQVENCFDVESSIALMIIHSEGVHTRHFSVGFLFSTYYFACDVQEFSPFLFCVLSWREVKYSRGKAEAELKNGVLCPMQVCSESSVFLQVVDFFLPSHTATKLQKRKL